jgi:hypothetical protein
MQNVIQLTQIDFDMIHVCALKRKLNQETKRRMSQRDKKLAGRPIKTLIDARKSFSSSTFLASRTVKGEASSVKCANPSRTSTTITSTLEDLDGSELIFNSIASRSSFFAFTQQIAGHCRCLIKRKLVATEGATGVENVWKQSQVLSGR